MSNKIIQSNTDWQPIETAPSHKIILIAYTQKGRKKQSVIKAFQCDQYDIKSGDQNDNSEYCEADDTYYIPGGWYEVIENWEDWGSIAVFGDVTDWMPVPSLPIKGKKRKLK